MSKRKDGQARGVIVGAPVAGGIGADPGERLAFGTGADRAQAQHVVRAGAGSAGGGELSGLTAIATNPYIVLGFALYGLGAVLWLSVLAKIDVGEAYPFMGLGFVVTMAFGILIFGEAFSLARAAGTLLVVAGVALVAAAS